MIPADCVIEPTALYYTFSTIAQVAAALAALIGFLGLWRLDKLRQESNDTGGEFIFAGAGRVGRPVFQEPPIKRTSKNRI